MASPNELAEPVRRGRGRPLKVMTLRVQPVARRTIDFHRLAKVLIAVVQREASLDGLDNNATNAKTAHSAREVDS